MPNTTVVRLTRRTATTLLQMRTPPDISAWMPLLTTICLNSDRRGSLINTAEWLGTCTAHSETEMTKFFNNANLKDFPSVLWHCWLGDGKCIQSLKTGCLSVMMIWLECCTSYSSSCYHHLHHPYTYIHIYIQLEFDSALAPVISRMQTFWYRLIQVHLENDR